MRRRALLASVPVAIAAAGCLASPDADRPGQEPTATESPDRPGATSTQTSKPGSRWTPVRRTADGVDATFRVVDGHAPTEDSVTASVEDDKVVVEGTLDPQACRVPVLDGVSRSGDTVRLVVATESRFGETATVECGNASYDYRVVVRVDGDLPAAVKVVTAYADGRREAVTISL